MSKQVILQTDNMSSISQKMSDNYDELLALINGGTSHADSECVTAFVAEMNKYASLFGMTNTNFVNPHGLNDASHYSCARDLCRLTMCATAYRRFMEYWGQTSYSVAVGGPNARTISGVSTYKGTAMETVGDYYHIFGGKSGSVTAGGSRRENLCLVVKSKVDDAWLVGCIMYNTNDPSAHTTDNRGVPFKEMLDWLEDYRQDPSTPTPTIQASYCSAWVVPPHTPTAYADMNLEMVGKSSTTQAVPASCTKMMTALVALDHLTLDETITIKSGDIESGTGDTFYAGDTINAGDAILAMMLPSSNTLAHAIARVVGNKILNGK